MLYCCVSGRRNSFGGDIGIVPESRLGIYQGRMTFQKLLCVESSLYVPPRDSPELCKGIDCHEWEAQSRVQPQHWDASDVPAMESLSSL